MSEDPASGDGEEAPCSNWNRHLYAFVGCFVGLAFGTWQWYFKVLFLIALVQMNHAGCNESKSFIPPGLAGWGSNVQFVQLDPFSALVCNAG